MLILWKAKEVKSTVKYNRLITLQHGHFRRVRRMKNGGVWRRLAGSLSGTRQIYLCGAVRMRKLAGMLDVPVTYLCDVEKNRCRIKDRLALLAEILALSDEEKIRMFELAGNASVDTDLSGYEMPACSLIEDPENGEKEWLQMVAELESRKN